MEAMVYRQSVAQARTEELHVRGTPADRRGAGGPSAASETRPLSPALFYPVVTEPEMVTWTHWLPTALVFERTGALSPAEMTQTLSSLQAPAAVLEEWDWSWTMDLFEAYAVRTPVRRDARDPLLLGRLGGQWYRLALWGESVRPLEEITALVQQSLTIRARAAKRRRWLGGGGTLPGLVLLAWGGSLVWAGQPVGTGLQCTWWIVFLACLWRLMQTPENCQQDFLDRYRR